ncbi:serine/threonine dehydratase [Allokutzneria sp. NRRL B-24872]|uniref:serine/threonine dehydratase n=1 Tax=Allokutzneria sp. NRRL B-24872 TaxID=1137961 RepID=UPI000A37283C|nr:serine/threonine dehydratase [Allokutzneria sp. NRRL B-24872]
MVSPAAARIAPYIRRTPLLRLTIDGRPLVLKLEHLQLTGSFKLRGATNALLSGPRPDLAVTASGGNHGMGVATAAQHLDIPARVHVPANAPESKLRRIRALGAEVVPHAGGYAEALATALEEGEKPGVRFVHAYDDPDVIAGQSTVGEEIVEDAPDVDAVAVAVGGGGLVTGIASAIGTRTVVAVEPATCCCFNAAVQAGHPVDSTVDSIAASALGAVRVGSLAHSALHERAVSLLVTDEEILAARDRLWEEARLAVEPAAAVPFAAWLSGAVPGLLPCVVLCGANTDWSPT